MSSSPPALVASAPVRIPDLLRTARPGPLRVLHRGATALYVELSLPGSAGPDESWCLGLVAGRAAALPCALRTPAPTLGALAAADPSLADGRLHLDGRPVLVGRLVEHAVPRPGPGATPLVPAHTLAELAELPDPVDRRSTLALLGRGGGLTPLGDDLLCGWLAWHRALGVPTPELDRTIAEARQRTTLLSATLLDCAGRGEVLPEYAAWVRAVGTQGEAAAAAALASVGHTSGAGLLHGSLRAAHQLSRERAVA